jgi:hypothetical protein
MPRTLPRKALISISSFNRAIYPNGQRTGLFFTEALHPFEVLTQAGFEVDIASETGTYVLDEISLTDPFLAGSDKAVFDNPKHPFNVKLNVHLKKASDLKKEQYGLFFASAGHSALYDYPSASGLQCYRGGQQSGSGLQLSHGVLLTTTRLLRAEWQPAPTPLVRVVPRREQ